MGSQIEVIEEVETSEVPLEYLEREICQLTSNIAAATARWLLLLAEFDRRDGWAVWGARSCAEWLSWRCGIGKVAAHDHLRVAHRLVELSVVRAAFAAGELSYSKVRAICRVATSETEENLVELARHATANHMEQIARAYRGVKRQIAKDKNGQDTKDDRYLHWYWDDDGYLVIAGRFPPEEGAIFIEALNAARAALAEDADKDQPAGDDSAGSGAAPANDTDPHDSAGSGASPTDHTDPRDSAESRTEPPHQNDPRDSAESVTPSPDHTESDDSAESGTPAHHTESDDSAESGTPAHHAEHDDSAESGTLWAGATEQSEPDDSTESRTPDHTDPRDSAESLTSSAAATSDSPRVTGPDDSAESRWATPEDDSTESVWTEEDDDYLNGYWMVPEDDECGELVWVASAETEEDDSAKASPGAPDDDDRDVPPAGASNRDSAESRRLTAADALVSMAETMLRHGPQARDGGDRYQAVVIVDAKALAGDGPGRCEIDNGPAISPELARRITCDSSVIMAILGASGEPLNIGRTTRTIPMAIRRALRIRDGKCRFPGCTQRRFVDGHHIQHWSQGGETSLENLVLLCRFHHRKVHEENFTVRYDGGTKFTFTRPDGTPIPEAPTAVPALQGHVVGANQELGLRIGPDTGSSLWAGEQLDLAMVIDGLFALEDGNLN